MRRLAYLWPVLALWCAVFAAILLSGCASDAVTVWESDNGPNGNEKLSLPVLDNLPALPKPPGCP